MKKNAIITIKLDRSYLFDAGGKAFDHAGDVLQVRVLDVLTNYVRVVTLDGQRDYEVKKTLVVKPQAEAEKDPAAEEAERARDCEPATMSKRYSKSNPRPPMVVQRGAGWYITFNVTSKEYSSYYDDGEYIASRATKDEAFEAIWDRFDANACVGFGCVDGCGDCVQVLA